MFSHFTSAIETLLNALRCCFLLQHLTILTALQLNSEHVKKFQAGFTNVDEVMLHTTLSRDDLWHSLMPVVLVLDCDLAFLQDMKEMLRLKGIRPGHR